MEPIFKYLTLAFCIGYMGNSFAATAPDDAERVFVIGSGVASCGSWDEARRKKQDVQEHVYVEWVAGFLAGHNSYRKSPTQQATPNDRKTIALFMDSYCKANPLHLIYFGAEALVESLGGTKTTFQWKRP